MYMRFSWRDDFQVLAALREFAQKARDEGDDHMAKVWDREAKEFEEKNIIGKIKNYAPDIIVGGIVHFIKSWDGVGLDPNPSLLHLS